MKIGDELLSKCKSIYKITSAGVFKKNTKYKIQDIIYNKVFYNNLYITRTSYIINEHYYSEYFVNAHFYSEKDIRKLKLEKINEYRIRKNSE